MKLTASVLILVCITACMCDDSSEEQNKDHNCNICPNRRSRRVCGENGVTYQSRCYVKYARCTTGKDIRIKHKGSCKRGTQVKDDSSDEDGSNSREFVPPFQPKTKTPRITTESLTTSKSSTRTTTVASTKSTAKPTETTSVKIESTSQTLSEIPTTSFPIMSTIDSSLATTMPFTLQCPTVCPLVRELVCGTDGTTYQSACVLQRVACANRDPTLMVASRGACDVTNGSDLPSSEYSQQEIV